jgi:hypothetical protein
MSNDKRQTAVKIIFEKFNLLSDRDFRSWMLNNYDFLETIEKGQIVDAVDGFPLDKRNLNGQEYYNQTYKQHE